MYVGVILVLCFSIVCGQMCSVINGDPCFLYNNQPLGYPDTRHPSVQFSTIDYDVNTHCDLYATNGNTWYRSEYNMTTSCVEVDSCGSIGPLWMNGTIPALDDGIVDRVGCRRSWDSCCSHHYNLRVKNCNYFTVYCFLELPSSCPERYCFDIDLSRTTTTTRLTSTTTKRPVMPDSSSSEHPWEGNECNDCHAKVPVVAVVILTIVVASSFAGNFVLAFCYYRSCRSAMNVKPFARSDPYKITTTNYFVEPYVNGQTKVDRSEPPRYDQLSIAGMKIDPYSKKF